MNRCKSILTNALWLDRSESFFIDTVNYSCIARECQRGVGGGGKVLLDVDRSDHSNYRKDCRLSVRFQMYNMVELQSASERDAWRAVLFPR